MQRLVDWGIGGIFSALWVSGGVSAASSIKNLCAVFTDSERTDEKMRKASKRAFLGVTSFAGTTGYALLWAHQAKVILLSAWLDRLKFLAYGSSFLSYGVKSFASLRSAYVERSELGWTDRLNYLLLKAAGNVCLLGWSVLGMAVAPGAVSSFYVLAPLLMGGVFSYAAHQHKILKMKKGSRETA